VNVIGIGLIGAGKIASIHAGAYASIDGARITAIYDSNRERAAAFAEAHRTSVATSLGDLLSNDEVNLVDICAPTPAHLEIIAAALAAEKDVVTEKPLARTVAEGRKAVALAQTSNRLLFVAHVLRFWPEYVAAHDQVLKQQLGKALAVTTYRLSAFPEWGTWFSDRSQSGGAILDLQIHDINFANWCFGRPTTVFSQRIDHPRSAADEVHTVLRYPGAKAEVVASYLLPDSYPFTAGFRVAFEDGAIEYRMRSAGVEVFADQVGNALTLYPSGGMAAPLDAPGEDPYAAELRHVIDCVRTREPSGVLSAKAGLEALEVCEASALSASSGRLVTLPTDAGSHEP
jgi:UDP-N-acetylglucosamine 3-dehydrogenase